MRRARALVSSVLLVTSGACRDAPPEPADLVVHGGTIRSLDADEPRPNVLVVRDGRVLALGSETLLERYRSAPRLDLAGRTLLPGLIDAHAHLLGLGRLEERLDLREARGYEDVLEAVRDAVAQAAPGEFVVGRGWNHEDWGDARYPTHERLSAVSPDNPVLLRRVDGHAVLVNAKVLEMSGIDATSASPEGGEIVRDADGRPTGLFVDAAMELLVEPPASTPEARERRLLLAQEACLSVGLTGVHDAGVDEETLALYERLAGEGRLLLRVNAMLSADVEDGAPADWLRRRLERGPSVGEHDAHLSVTAVKIYADGALGSHGAALLEPYSDRPERQGLFQLSREELRRQVALAHRHGFQAAVHAIGDAANRRTLDVFEEVLGADAATTDHRFRVEHAQVIALDDVPRFAELGVIASVQPTHATSDMNMAEDRVGPERIRGAYAWRRLLDAGARLALGSDFPVESENPFFGLHAAVTRQDHEGRPPGGWYPGQALTAEEALRGFTEDAAFAGFEEGAVGSLSPGKHADFVVVGEDPLRLEPSRLFSLRPDSTWVGGELVHAREGRPEAAR